MKYLLAVFMLGTLAAPSCSKPTLHGNTSVETITGRWKYTQSFYSNGGRLLYTPTDNLNQWIELGADGSFASNMPVFKGVLNYELLDSARVKLITPTAPQTERRFFISIDSTAHTLSLSPADSICIEGCGDKFKR